MRPKSLKQLMTLFVAGAATTACTAGPAAAPAGNERVTPEYTDGRLSRLSSDRSGDGTVDTWAYMNGTEVSRVEVDEDGDGKVDRWEYHTPGSAASPGGSAVAAGALATPDKTIERIERATKHDGSINRKEFFSRGELTRVEEDTDGDGLLDKWETYENGALVAMEIDTQKRGKPDRRLVYGSDGSFVRIESDPTGSGHYKPVTQ